MKIPIIKQLVENYNAEQLRAAEMAIEEGQTPEITIPGDDEGEQLTHAYAAGWIRKKVDSGQEFTSALREYTAMVRKSIS